MTVLRTWDRRATRGKSACACECHVRRFALYRQCVERVCAEHGSQLRTGAAADGGGADRLPRRPVADGLVAGRGAYGSGAARGLARLGSLVPRLPRAEHARLRPGWRVRAVGTT